MPKFLVKGNYVGQGISALIKDGGSGRLAEIEKLIGGGGGTVEHVFFAFGETDLYVVADIPDKETAAALSLRANATGAVRVSVTVLLTPDEMDDAARHARGYAPPTFD